MVNEMSWYVIFVETGYEDEFCRYTNKINNQRHKEIQYNLLVPKRKIFERKQGIRREVVKTMFPGYVLLETEFISKFFLKARSSPHVIRFLRVDSCFLEVRKEEIRQILKMSDSGGLIDISKGFIENDKVKIVEGPLLGMEGVITKIDKRKGRAKVKFTLSERDLLIDLGIEILEKIVKRERV